MTELQPPEPQLNGATAAVTSPENVGGKRQRRPSVRLGDIGGDQSEDLRRSRNFQWRNQENRASSSSKTRAFLNLGGFEGQETLGGDEREGNLDGVAIGSWKAGDFKSKRRSDGGIKRSKRIKGIRTNWVSKMGDGGGENDELDKFSDDGGEGFRVVEDSESLGISRGDRDSMDGFRMEGNWGRNGERNGVRVWLNELGLGRYAPVFEIHEVDDEVLPMLTLEDLKEMGINAVGSRRKMYYSIQRLGKNFS